MFYAWHGNPTLARWLELRPGTDALTDDGMVEDGDDAGPGGRLIEACARGHAHVVRELLLAVADPQDLCNFSTSRLGGNVTPLYAACFFGHEDCVALLLEASANVNCAHTLGSSPLYIACHRGHAHIVTMLLKLAGDSIDVNQQFQVPILPPPPLPPSSPFLPTPKGKKEEGGEEIRRYKKLE